MTLLLHLRGCQCTTTSEYHSPSRQTSSISILPLHSGPPRRPKTPLLHHKGHSTTWTHPLHNPRRPIIISSPFIRESDAEILHSVAPFPPHTRRPQFEVANKQFIIPIASGFIAFPNTDVTLRA
jgi:hypothetical protein